VSRGISQSTNPLDYPTAAATAASTTMSSSNKAISSSISVRRLSAYRIRSWTSTQRELLEHAEAASTPGSKWSSHSRPRSWAHSAWRRSICSSACRHPIRLRPQNPTRMKRLRPSVFYLKWGHRSTTMTTSVVTWDNVRRRVHADFEQ
jgi:hypothetical protein